MNTICLEHINNYNNNCTFSYYCKQDNKHLCEYCINEGIHTHGNIFPENIKFIAPFEINNLKEEKILFDVIIKILKNKILDISQKKKKNLKAEKQNKINKIIENYEKEIKNYDINQEKDKNKIEEKYNEDIKKINKNYYDILTNEIKKFYDDNIVLLNDVNNKNQINDDNYDANNKFNLISNFYEKINYEYKNFNNRKNKFDNEMKTLKTNKDKDINEIKEKYRNFKDISNKNKISLIDKLNKDYEIKINDVDVEENNTDKNKIEYEIIFTEIIFNTYNLAPRTNYFYAKNLQKLMMVFYNNQELYKIFKNQIESNYDYNSTDRKKLLDAIDNKIKNYNQNEENALKNKNIIKNDDNNNNKINISNDINKNNENKDNENNNDNIKNNFYNANNKNNDNNSSNNNFNYSNNNLFNILLNHRENYIT
jgi:hypothetical protein